MINDPTTTVLVVAPRGDSRWRVSRSVKLWVMSRRYSKDGTYVEVCGAVESIERVVYVINGDIREWVRYSGSYHPLHPVHEFTEILKMARKRKLYFFNNEIGARGDSIKVTSPAPFIFLDEVGPPA